MGRLRVPSHIKWKFDIKIIWSGQAFIFKYYKSPLVLGNKITEPVFKGICDLVNENKSHEKCFHPTAFCEPPFFVVTSIYLLWVTIYGTQVVLSVSMEHAHVDWVLKWEWVWDPEGVRGGGVWGGSSLYGLEIGGLLHAIAFHRTET